MGQTILVTGSSSGFGRLIVETLARQGHTVFAGMRAVAGKNAPAADELRALARAFALPAVVESMRPQLEPANLEERWKRRFAGQIPTASWSPSRSRARCCTWRARSWCW